MSDTPPPGSGDPDASGTSPPAKSPGELSLLLQRLAAADDAEPEAFDAGLRPGTAVGRFEVLREIGRGGFGAVYEALDRELGRRVALKLLRPRKSGQTRDAEALAAEARALAGLDHPAVVALFDVGSSPAGPFLVEELLRGETLGERLRRGPLPPAEALRVAIAVARVLAQAHRQGVVHRDLKPDNVFLCEDGRVKLLDFGLAHLLGAKSSPAAGTPAYMAPEQALGQEVDGRADVFAAAAVLHECLAGARPFAAGEDGYPRFDAPPKALPAAVPKALARLVRAGLALSPEARPGSGRAWLDALRRAEQALDRPARLRRLGALVTVGALLGAAVAGVLVWRSRPRLGDLPEEVRKTVAVLPFTPLSEDKEAEHLADGVQVEMIATLSQRPDLVVIGRSSVEAWRKPPRDLPAIAGALGVGSVLEGSVQRVGNRIRIVVSLLDPRTGRSLWTERYDRELADVLAVQSEVSGHVAKMLGARVAGERAPSATGNRVHPEAYASYLAGRGAYAQSMGVVDDYAEAMQLLARAVRLDPEFAPAFAWLAAVETNAIHRASAAERVSLLEKARDHVAKALELDPNLAIARAAAAYVAGEEGRWEESDKAAEEAYALAPTEPWALSNIASIRFAQGRWQEALALREHLVRRDPRNAAEVTTFVMDAIRMGQFDRAGNLCEGLAAWMPRPRPVADIWCARLPAWRRGDLRAFRALATHADADTLFYAGSDLAELEPSATLARLADPGVAASLPPRIATYVRGIGEERLGHVQVARRAFEEVLAAARGEMSRDREASGPVRLAAAALARLGRFDEATALVSELPQKRLAGVWFERHKAWWLRAEIAVRVGRRGEAVDVLERLLERPIATTPAYLRVDPRFEALHGDPRFEAMLAKHAKLPELPDP